MSRRSEHRAAHYEGDVLRDETIAELRARIAAALAICNGPQDRGTDDWMEGYAWAQVQIRAALAGEGTPEGPAPRPTRLQEIDALTAAMVEVMRVDPEWDGTDLAAVAIDALDKIRRAGEGTDPPCAHECGMNLAPVNPTPDGYDWMMRCHVCGHRFGAQNGGHWDLAAGSGAQEPRP